VCDCPACRLLARGGVTDRQAFDLIRQHDRHAIDRHGWSTHTIVASYPHSIHTHGLREKFGHPDLQVVLHLSPEDLVRLVEPIAVAVSQGRWFRAGEEVADLFRVPVRFREYREGRRTVLRAIFPDDKGRWPEDPTAPQGWRDQLLTLMDT